MPYTYVNDGPLGGGMYYNSDTGDYYWTDPQGGNEQWSKQNPMPGGAGGGVTPGVTGTAQTYSPTGGEVVTGTQIPLDAESIRRSQDESRIAQATLDEQRRQFDQQFGLNSQLGQGQLAVQQGQLGVSQGQLALAGRQFEETQAQNQRQYELDLKQFGETVARRLFDERMGEATVRLQQQRLGLDASGQQIDQNRFNFDQRNALAQGKMGILQMLADRSGPQDWVAYNNLLNGLNAPNPQASSTIDPYAILEGLYQESNVRPGVNRYNTGLGASTESAAQGTIPVGAAAQGVSDASGVGTMAPTTTPPPAANSTPPSMPTGGGTGLTTGAVGGAVRSGGYPASGPAVGPNGSVIHPARPAPQPGTIPVGASPADPFAPAPAVEPFNRQGSFEYAWNASGTPEEKTRYALQSGQRPPGLADGGVIQGGQHAVVGDSPRGRPGTENQELVVNLNPDPADRVAVIPVSDLVRKPGRKVPRAAGGGVYGATDPTKITLNTYRPSDTGGQPFIQKLSGNMNAPAFSGFGAKLSNPLLGVEDAPDLINWRALQNLAPSEFKQAGSLYDQGLSASWDDIVERSKRAAFFGRTLGSSVYAGR